MSFLFFHSFFLNFYSFIYFFWLRWVFVAARGLPLVVASRGYSSLRRVNFSLPWLLLSQSTGSKCVGFSSCGTQAQQLWLAGSRAQAQQWCMGLVAPQHVGSSQTRARTHVPCTGKRFLNHCVTREFPILSFFLNFTIINIYYYNEVEEYSVKVILPRTQVLKLQV